MQCGTNNFAFMIISLQPSSTQENPKLLCSKYALDTAVGESQLVDSSTITSFKQEFLVLCGKYVAGTEMEIEKRASCCGYGFLCLRIFSSKDFSKQAQVLCLSLTGKMLNCHED